MFVVIEKNYMARKKRKKPISIKSFLIPKLRRASRFWRAKGEARKKAQIVTVVGQHKNGKEKTKIMYQCNICSSVVDLKDSSVDHIRPVVGLDGFTTWDDYINTLFCEADNLQTICNSCHDHKTQLEVEERKRRKKLLTNGTSFAKHKKNERVSKKSK